MGVHDDLEDLSRRAARAQNGADPSRAGPEPWFVGSNTRLTMIVVTVVALLIVARLVTSVWMVEEAWDWWRHRPVAVDKPRMPIPIPPRSVVSPRNPAGIVAASARGDERLWITAEDYPNSSLNAGEEGRVTLGWTIDTSGRVRDCHVVRSSGYARLDAAGCNALTRRGRYRPAFDRSGNPIATTKTRTIVWAIPPEE